MTTTPGASWTRISNGSWWYWHYPRADVDITGRVSDDGSWVVLVEEEEILRSKVPARSLKTAGKQCWRAMLRASVWNSPQYWRLRCAVARLGVGLVSVGGRIDARLAKEESSGAW